MPFAHSRFHLLPLRHGLRTMSSITQYVRPLPVSRPSLEEENALYEQRTAEMAEFFALPRFRGIKRPYAPTDVASKQGFMPVVPLPSTLLADKLYATLSKAAEARQPVHTMGAIDPVQMTQMARYQDVVYISGWAASSLLTTANNEVGPDLGLAVFPHFCDLSDAILEIIHILRFQIKFTEYFEHNSCMIRNTMTNAYP